MFSREPWKDDPRNHCVPAFDVIQDYEDPTMYYIVMPFLRHVDDPPFETVADVVDFVDQILQVRCHDIGVHPVEIINCRDSFSCMRGEWLTGKRILPV